MQQKKDKISSNKRLKKKVVYVYESDSDEEKNAIDSHKDSFLT